MTEPEFRFKLAIAVGQYVEIYKYKPVALVTLPSTCDMLSNSGKVNFSNNNPTYEGMHISWKYAMHEHTFELGTAIDKLEF